MRKDSLLLIGVTAVGGAFALFVRWLQNLTVFDAATGLANPGAAVSWILVLLCVAVAVAQLLLILRMHRRPAEVTETIAENKGAPLARIATIALAVLCLAGAALMLLSARFSAGKTTLMLCLSILAVFTALSLLWLALCKSENSALHCLCCTVPVLFYCLWLIIAYKDNASNPVLWSFAPEILAISGGILSWFFAAGYVYGKPQPVKALFFTHFSVFLSILVLADERALGMQLLLLCPALSLLFLSERLRTQCAPQPEVELPDTAQESASEQSAEEE